MLRKTIQLLKNNPSITFFQVIYILITFFGTNLLYSVRQSEISNYVIYCVKFLFSSVLSLLMGTLFISGFGNTLSESITLGKSRLAAFITGIRKCFIKSLFSILILYTINAILSSILLPIASQIILDIFLPYGGEVRNLFYYILISIINILIMPFIMLFLPAIYIDHCDIMTGLITGIKHAIRNYRKLVWVLFVMYIPIFINIIFLKDAVMFVFTPLPIMYILDPIVLMSGNAFTVSTVIMYFVEASIFLVSAPLFFVIYKESSSKRLLF